MATPKLLEAACKGTHLPDDEGSRENFVYEGLENADGPAVQTGAWVADVAYERAPHGEDSLSLWQINIDPAQADNPDTFDCSEIAQWASGPAVGTGAVTYVEPSSAPPFAKPATFTATISNSEPVTYAGWGPWEDNRSLSEDLGIAWVSGDGGTRNLGNDAVFITNLTGRDHGSSILEFSVENFPNNSPSAAPVEGFGLDRGHMGSSFELVFPAQTTFPQGDGNAVAIESLEIAHEGFIGESGLPAFGYHLGDTAIEATKLPMQHPETALSPDQAVTWTAIAMAESGGSIGSDSVYSLYDLIV